MPEDELPVPELAPEPVPMMPVARQERIAAMDVLRGIAVFGIFLINMPLYLAPASAFFNWEDSAYWTRESDRLITLLIYIFAQGKFYTLFSFLFGLGFGVQMLRASERNSPDFLATYRRRIFVLLTIGVLHWTLIWWGDVLHVYALLGFFLILVRNKPDKRLLIIALACTLAPLAGGLIGTTVQHFTDKTTVEEKAKKESERQQRRQKKVLEDVRVMSKGTIPEIIQYRVKVDLDRLPGELGWSTELFANFLLGLWVSRRRILQEPQNYRPLLTKLAYIALPIGLAFATADLVYGYMHPAQESPLWRIHTGLIREFLARPAIAYGYAALLLLIGIRSWMSPIAAVGRMALTNYLLHSLVFTTLVNSYGMGTYGRVHPLQGFYYCCAFYALQIPFSMLWLKYFQFGPAEWVWRSLTYGVRQPWLKAAA